MGVLEVAVIIIAVMCQLCYVTTNNAALIDAPAALPSGESVIGVVAGGSHRWLPRRAFLALAAGAAAAPVVAQVQVDSGSRLKGLVPAGQLEQAATQEYAKMLSEARQKGALAPEGHPQLQRIRAIAARLVPQSLRFNPRARDWRWEVNLFGSKQINAFCMPGGKIGVYTGLLDQLRLSDDEAAMVIGHEVAHALLEHARERIAKTQTTGMVASGLAAILGLGQIGDLAANAGTQLLALRFSREDEVESDLVGLELAARAAYQPEASVSLWQKMAQASGGDNRGPAFLSTHPTGPDRIRRLQDNIPRVRGLYEQAVALRR